MNSVSPSCLAFPVETQGLRDSNWQVRLAAAEAMAQLGEVKREVFFAGWEGMVARGAYISNIYRAIKSLKWVRLWLDWVVI